jgi:GR25 family glycosyltransferase involved in LPS biosynthesis
LDAVNGRTIVLNKEICKLFKNNDFKWKKSVMGCALSHYILWKEYGLASGPSKTILVLEDDALLVDSFTSKWNSISGTMPADADFVYLGGVLPPNKPGLPMVTEPVNSNFARVKVNTLFGGSRRFFHFCTYSYIMTSSGARKMYNLIQEKGIFTSADHMIVNHMDLFNIYFTTPLLSGCTQDNDPVYQKSDFNNFNRVDKFDSEIWNNTDVFSPDEVASIGSGVTKFEPLKRVYFQEKEIKEDINSEWLTEIFQRDFEWISPEDKIAPGTTVLLNYIQHTSGNIIKWWINRNADCKIFIIHGDETSRGEVDMYNHPSVKAVFRNYWRPNCISSKVMHIPLGYLNGKGGNGRVIVSSQRPLTWSFAGAMDRNNRRAIVDDLNRRYPNNKIHLTPTWGSAQNLGANDYTEILRKTKFVPCLDGFFNTESFRFYEALEAGALPVICLDEKRSYEKILPGAPLLTVKSWSDEISFDWDTKQREILQWWVNYKAVLKNLIAEKLALA